MRSCHPRSMCLYMPHWCRGNSFRARLLLLLVLILLGLSTRAQRPFIRDFWLNESNTPVRVNDLLYEPSGYIWLATDRGVFRFNGRSFVPIQDSIFKPATALGFHEGRLIAGYRDGSLALLVDEQMQPFALANDKPASTITSLHSIGHFLWITTEEEGLFLAMHGAGLHISTEDGLTDNFLYDVHPGANEVMIATDRGINCIRWDGQKPVIDVFTTAQGLPDNIVRVLRPIPGTEFTWVGTQEGGLVLYDGRERRLLSPGIRHPWAWGQVNDVLPLSVGEAWVATEEGYLLHVFINDDSLEVQSFSYDGRKILKLVKDKAGNIWCATNTGLMLNTAVYACQLTLPQDYRLNDVTAMTIDARNVLWYSQNGSLYRLPLQSRQTPQHILNIPDTTITCLYPGPEPNTLWIGSFGKGLLYYDGEKVQSVRGIPNLESGLILSIAVVDSSVWVASLNGVEETRLRPGSPVALELVRHHSKASGTGSDYVYQLYPDRKGRIWMATDGGGVRMYDGGQYESWDLSEGLGTEVVYSITEDPGGDVWAAALEQGLLRYGGSRWQLMTEREGLQHINITALLANRSGEVVVVNQEGVDQWYPASRQFRHFNRRLNLDIDSTSSVLNCIARDTGGNVYVPFEHGFLIFRDRALRIDIKPSVRINRIHLFSQPAPPGATAFRHDENHISFAFDGINYTHPEQLYYRYMLEGYDNNWIYTNDEVVAFAQLPPGEYKFRVQASLNNLFAGASEDSYSFTIILPFWRTPWFLAMAVMTIVALGYGYVTLRERHLQKLSHLQRERMVFEYEHLKSQVNPHFLFNSLNTLVSLIEEDREAAVNYTVHLSDLYRNMLSFKDQDLILLSEELEIITNYMHIQQSRFGHALVLQTRIPEVVKSKRKIVPLALQLLVENAIKHNVVSIAQPLTITIEADDEKITVSNPIQRKQSREKGAGLGILNIEKRYSLLTDRIIKFGQENGCFVVQLPLL